MRRAFVVATLERTAKIFKVREQTFKVKFSHSGKTFRIGSVGPYFYRAQGARSFLARVYTRFFLARARTLRRNRLPHTIAYTRADK